MICCCSHHCCSTWLTNSGPLSTRITAGLLRCPISFSSTLFTRNEGRDVSTSNASDSRLKSSITLSTRNLLPSTRLSLIKSMLHVWSACAGITRGCFYSLRQSFLCPAPVRSISFAGRFCAPVYGSMVYPGGASGKRIARTQWSGACSPDPLVLLVPLDRPSVFYGIGVYFAAALQ